MITRQFLDAAGEQLTLPAVYRETKTMELVNGSLGHYRLWTLKGDTSIRPCLTGDVGGMRGAWENWVTAWHINNFSDFDTYIDIGANCGYFSFLAERHGLLVYAIEANADYVAALEESNFCNSAYVCVVHAAVSDSEGFVGLTVPTGLHGAASSRHGDTNLPGTIQRVRTITLDNASFANDLMGQKVLIKMDIEGAEQMAFNGAGRFNDCFKPTYILEYTPRHYDEFFYDELLSYGDITMIDFNGNETAVTKSFANSQDDWITLVVRPR